MAETIVHPREPLVSHLAVLLGGTRSAKGCKSSLNFMVSGFLGAFHHRFLGVSPVTLDDFLGDSTRNRKRSLKSF